MAMFLTNDDYFDASHHTPTGGKRIDRRQSDVKRRKVETSGNYWFLTADDDINDGATEEVEDHECEDEDSDSQLDESDIDEYEWDSDDYDSDSSLEGLMLEEEGDDDVFESDTEDTSNPDRTEVPSQENGCVRTSSRNTHRRLEPQDLRHVMATTPPIRGGNGYNWPWLD